MATRREEITKIKQEIFTHGMKIFDYQDFKEIDNPTFHRLREAYLKARERFLNYIDNHSE